MSADDPRQPEAVPLAQERVFVDKREVETGKVRLRTSVAEEDVIVRDELLRESVNVERVPVGREVDEAPQIRREGDTLIVPVVEERQVVEKRLVLVEELHIRTERTSQPVEQPVTLRKTVVDVDRERLDQTSNPESPGTPP